MFKVGETVVSDLMEVIGVVIQENCYGENWVGDPGSNGRYAIKDVTGYVWHLDEKAELRKATAVEIKNLVESIRG